MAYSFDGIAKIITLSTGTTTVSVRDVYSRWVDWFISENNNQRFLPAFLTVGGDNIDLEAGTKIPIYAFLLNGWRIKPQSSDHTLNVNDGVLLVDGGGDPFINPDGDYVVRINYQQPVQAISYDSSGGGSSYTLEQIADAVWTRTQRALTEAAGLTTEEHNKLMSTATKTDVIVASQL